MSHDNSQEIDPSELQIGECIGEGTTALVYIAEWKGEKVAVKEIRTEETGLQPETIEAVRRELRFLSKVTHPNILGFRGLVLQKAPLQIVLEYCEGGSLFDLLHNRYEIPLSWPQRLRVLYDTASAMNHLHNYNPRILHRDLKSLNLMLLKPVTNPEDVPIVKLCDFGFARLEGHAMTEGVGTSHWMAPEVVHGTVYSEKADVFSFAIVTYETVFRVIPYERLRPQAVTARLVSGDRPPLDDHPEDTPQALLQLIQLCWDMVPENRPAFDQIMATLSECVA